MTSLRFTDCQIHIEKKTSNDVSVILQYDQGRRASVIAFYFSTEEAVELGRAMQAVAS